MAKTRQSLSRRLTMLNLIVSAAAVFLACVSFLAYEVGSFRLNIMDDLSIQAQIIGSNSASSLIFADRVSAEKTLAALQASPHITFAGIYDPTGQFFAGYWRGGRGSEPPFPGSPAMTTERRWFQDWQARLVRPIIFDGQRVGTVYITSDLQGLISRAGTYAVILISILAISLIGALVVSRVSQRKISVPIIRLADTTRHITRDRNYALRVAPPPSHDEIAVLINSFNEMLVEIQQRDDTLRESERQFRSLADSLPQQAWSADAEGRIVWFNKRWYDFSGVSDALKAVDAYTAIVDPAVLPEVMRRWSHSVATGDQFEMVFPLRGRDGVYREFLSLSVPVRDSSGKTVRWFGTNTDVTEQRRSEEALRRTEKLAATGRLAASIAHEINNPLEALTNLIYLARRNPAKSESYLAIADQELDRIAEITKHTLGFYRDTSTPIRVDIAEVLREVLELYSRKIQFKSITVTERYAPSTQVLGYPGELRQIFANLVSNAIEAMADKGHLTIKASNVHDGPAGEGLGVRVSLMDDGSGISRAQMAKIFEPFYTTKKDTGTGLGLWLTQNLVAKHHGRIRVRSRVDSGKSWTVFSVYLPADHAGSSLPPTGNRFDSAVS